MSQGQVLSKNGAKPGFYTTLSNVQLCKYDGDQCKLFKRWYCSCHGHCFWIRCGGAKPTMQQTRPLSEEACAVECTTTQEVQVATGVGLARHVTEARRWTRSCHICCAARWFQLRRLPGSHLFPKTKAQLLRNTTVKNNRKNNAFAFEPVS